MHQTATSLSVNPEWLGLFLVGVPILFATLAWYVKVVVDKATLSIRERNNGSHIADLPDRIRSLERQHDELSHSMSVVAENQLRIMNKMGGFDE